MSITNKASTSSGSYLSVSSSDITDTDETTLEGLTYTKIEGVTTIPANGPTRDVTEQEFVDGTIQKLFGATNNGNPAMTAASMPLDPGQIILNAMAGTTTQRAFSITLNDAPTDDYTPTVIYFVAKVSTKELGDIENGTQMMNYTINIDDAYYIDWVHTAS